MWLQFYQHTRQPCGCEKLMKRSSRVKLIFISFLCRVLWATLNVFLRRFRGDFLWVIGGGWQRAAIKANLGSLSLNCDLLTSVHSAAASLEIASLHEALGRDYGRGQREKIKTVFILSNLPCFILFLTVIYFANFVLSFFCVSQFLFSLFASSIK